MTALTPPPPLGPGQPVPVADLGRAASSVTSHLGGDVAIDHALVDRLRQVCTSVHTEDEIRVEAGRDWWPLAVSWAVNGEVPALPAVVARPGSAAEVAAVINVCREAQVPVTPAAGRSGVCGGAVPVFGGVALDLCGLNGIIAVDDVSLVVDVAAGTFGDHLEAQLRQHGLTLGHWPQSIAMSTVGGWLACRSAGQYSTRYGKIEDMIVGLEVALTDGRVIRTGGAGPRSASGPDLNQVFVGSEGTLGVITQARLRVHPMPEAERRAAYSFHTFAAGLEACRHILRRGATPAVLRLYDGPESRRSFDVDDRCVLLALDEGDPVLVDATMAVVADECISGQAASGQAASGEGTSAQVADPALVERWLAHRNEVTSLEALAHGGVVADTIEIAAPWRVLAELYDEAVAALGALPATIAASAHQSHAYTDGACLYFTFAGVAKGADAPAWSPGRADEYYRQAWDAVLAVTLACGGSLSHHHGVGLNRGRHLPAALGTGFAVLARLKAALDPDGILNPGKLGLTSPFGPPPWPSGG
ncbi:MAG: FAD-binding oxidoreductase [Actinomycetota bacterium]|nr:FAD-binding oxidoreductase [Actinomycetota bacterium]